MIIVLQIKMLEVEGAEIQIMAPPHITSLGPHQLEVSEGMERTLRSGLGMPLMHMPGEEEEEVLQPAWVV